MFRGETGAAGGIRPAFVRFLAERRDLRTRTPGNIDEATFIDGEPGLMHQRFGTDVPRGAPFFVRGWAVDLGRRAVPWDILIEVDGRVIPARIQIGDERPDIVKLVGTPAVLGAGFRAYFETSRLAAGPHDLAVRAIVGRRGTAFARIPSSTRLFVHDRLPNAFAPPDSPDASLEWFGLDPLEPLAAGEVLAVSGWALDGRGKPLRAIAARLDGGVWVAGWTGVERAGMSVARAGFRLRMRLDTVAPGLHRVELAGRTAAGGWVTIGEARPLIVTFVGAARSPWLRTLASDGEAVITAIDGVPDACWSKHRVTGTGCALTGVLRRSSPPGIPVTVVARPTAGDDVEIPAWSAPTTNPNAVVFGARIDARTLRPGSYRVFVDAPDAARRSAGRVDTGCVLVLEPRRLREDR